MLTRPQWMLIGFVGGTPLVLALMLNLLRPDLVAPMRRHLFGLLVAMGIVTFSLAAGGIATLSSFWVNRAAPVGEPGRYWRLAVSGLLPFLLCTLPAMFVALFGPIVFALVFGDVGRSASAP